MDGLGREPLDDDMFSLLVVGRIRLLEDLEVLEEFCHCHAWLPSLPGGLDKGSHSFLGWIFVGPIIGSSKFIGTMLMNNPLIRLAIISWGGWAL